MIENNRTVCKATEFRMVLLYTFPILFKGRIPQKFYDHFLLLHYAIRILCDAELCISNNKCAHSMIVNFVKKFGELYGEHQVSYNVHCLLHLAEDVRNMNAPLDSYSCFKFENYLQTVKKTPKNGHRVLEQISNRYAEKMACKMSIASLSRNARHENPPLSSFGPNNYCIIPGYGLSKIEKIEKGFLEVRLVRETNSLYERPLPSNLLNIFVSNNGLNLSEESVVCKSTEQIRIVCHLNIDEEHYFLALLHDT